MPRLGMARRRAAGVSSDRSASRATGRVGSAPARPRASKPSIGISSRPKLGADGPKGRCADSAWLWRSLGLCPGAEQRPALASLTSRSTI